MEVAAGKAASPAIALTQLMSKVITSKYFRDSTVLPVTTVETTDTEVSTTNVETETLVFEEDDPFERKIYITERDFRSINFRSIILCVQIM